MIKSNTENLHVEEKKMKKMKERNREEKKILTTHLAVEKYK